MNREAAKPLRFESSLTTDKGRINTDGSISSQLTNNQSLLHAVASSAFSLAPCMGREGFLWGDGITLGRCPRLKGDCTVGALEFLHD
jgi:hypothetical protein